MLKFYATILILSLLFIISLPIYIFNFNFQALSFIPLWFGAFAAFCSSIVNIIEFKLN